MMYFIQEDNFLTAKFEFKNFWEALNFVIKIWKISEQYNHHPNISIHDYRFVSIETTTHDTWNTITQKDYDIVEAIEKVFNEKTL